MRSLSAHFFGRLFHPAYHQSFFPLFPSFIVQAPLSPALLSPAAAFAPRPSYLGKKENVLLFENIAVSFSIASRPRQQTHGFFHARFLARGISR